MQGGGGVLSPAIGMGYAINDIVSVSLKARYIYSFMLAQAYLDADFNGTIANPYDELDPSMNRGDPVDTKWNADGHGYGMGEM